MREFITRMCALTAGITSSSAATVCVPVPLGFLHAHRGQDGCLEPGRLLPLSPLTPSFSISCLVVWADFSNAVASQISRMIFMACISGCSLSQSPPSFKTLLVPLSQSPRPNRRVQPWQRCRPARPSVPALLPMALSAGCSSLPWLLEVSAGYREKK